AAAGAAVLVGRAELAVAVAAYRQDELLLGDELGEAFRRHLRLGFLVRLPRGVAQVILALLLVLHPSTVENRQGYDFVAVIHRHAAHSGAGAALEFADVVAGEAYRLAFTARQQHVVPRIE